MSRFLDALLDALSFAFGMGWEILWALILGFTLSGAVQAVVSKREMRRLLPDSSPRSLAIATALGAASSSCSYAAIALARSLFRKGADFISAIAFEIASTNLVLELGIIMALVLGWQFTAAEFVGGPIIVILATVLLRRVLRPHVIEAARRQAERGVRGSMEAHATMDMSVQAEGPLLGRLTSAQGVTATAGYFVMDWAAVLRDIVGGLLIAGAFAAWVPDSFWRGVFLEHHSTLSVIWGPLIGPLVAIVSFVCSIGNVPLAAVLWNGGISFGGVISFIYADLLIIPILDIYRRYYGVRMTIILSGVLYTSMVAAGLIVDLVFRALGLVPSGRHAKVVEASVTLNYTTVLNAIFLALAGFFVWRFLATGGLPMLLHMNDAEAAGDDPHGAHDHM
ncbi:MAG: uncharacterized protein QOI43_2388 [Gaiellales bacterium]|nr:uncharacterized protein [Gaiellales bacterium]